MTTVARHGVFAVVAQLLTLVAAFHGAGQGIVRLTRRPPLHPLLATQIGIAGMIAISGLAILLGFDRYAFQVALVAACAGLHCVLLVVDVAHYRGALERVLAGSKCWVVPVCLLLAIAFVQVLGAAGDLGARPFDDDGNVLAQLQRLRDTGTLDDLIGYPRRAQLGGQLALTALATVPGDVHLARMLEGLAFVLALGLVLAQLRISERTGALVGILVVVAASALPFVPADPTTCWTGVGMILALHALLQAARREHDILIALVAGALITLRTELAPIAIAALFTARSPDRRRTITLIAIALAVVAPYLVAKILADGHGSALLADKRLAWAVALLVFVGTCLACAPLVLWTWRNERLRWYGVACALAIAGIASELTGDRPYGLRFLWPLAFSGAAILVIEHARAQVSTSAMLLVGIALAFLVHEGLTATGRRKWPRRYLDLVDNIEYLRAHGTEAPITASYDDLLATLTPDTRVGIWVTRPERMDYAAHRIVDLRTPRTVQLRPHRWTSHASRIEKLARAVRVDFVFLERDDRNAQRIQSDWMYRFVCVDDYPACADDLEMLAVKYPVVAERDGMRLIDLRAAR